MNRLPWGMLTVSLTGVAAGAAAVTLAVQGSRGPAPLATGLIGCLVGWSLIAGGLVAQRLRLERRIGLVLIAIGFAWLATFLQYAGSSLVATLGIAVENVYLVGFVWLVLAFPTGRLGSRRDQALVAAAVLLATIVEWAWLLVARKPCGGCGPNAFQVWNSSRLADAILAIQRGLGVVLSLVTIAIVVRRWRTATPVRRRQAAPVLWAGALLLAALTASVVNDLIGAPLGDAADFGVAATLALLPIAVVVVLLRRRLDRATVASLVVELGAAQPMPDLQQLLSRTLRDPTLRVGYWLDDRKQFAQRDGQAIELASAAADGVTMIERDGRRIAALVHDPALRERRELVESVSAVVALRLDNERLEAELRARARELEASRARLVEATDSERRRLERDLHDGAQQQLISVAMTLGLARARERSGGAVADLLGEAQAALERALGELRQLCRGLLPPLLRERGLEAALRDLCRRAPVRNHITVAEGLPPIAPSAEAALFFVLSEGLANAAKHAHASNVEIALGPAGHGLLLSIEDDGRGGADPSGFGLRGLADRLGALGGHFAVGPAPVRGTRLEAWVPCA